MFIGRQRELKVLEGFFNDKGALLVYGLRRIGKTTLIKKALSDSGRPFVYFECQKASEATNASLFVDLLREQLDFPRAVFVDFLSVFRALRSCCRDFVFVIDEYSTMKEYYLESRKADSRLMAERLDSEFQNIVDEALGDNRLILSGSSIHLMESLSEHGSPLYGRFASEICLRPLSYLEAKEMFPSLSDSSFLALYSVFGGSPFVLSKIDPSSSLETNICSLLLDEFGVLRSHLRNNVIRELEGDPDLHEILDVIKNGSKKYGEIQAQCHITTSGLLDKRLKKLLDLDILEARFPIGKESDRKKKFYSIKDNLLKFYYAYAFRQENRIGLLGEKRFYEVFIAPSIKDFLSRRFESIVRDYFSIAVKKGMYPDIIDIGSYFTESSEFDCVLKKTDGTYAVYEVKLYAKPMKAKEIYEEMSQIKAIKGLPVTEIGFLCSAGYEKRIEGARYLTLDDLFFKEKPSRRL